MQEQNCAMCNFERPYINVQNFHSIYLFLSLLHFFHIQLHFLVLLYTGIAKMRQERQVLALQETYSKVPARIKTNHKAIVKFLSQLCNLKVFSWIDAMLLRQVNCQDFEFSLGYRMKTTKPFQSKLAYVPHRNLQLEQSIFLLHLMKRWTDMSTKRTGHISEVSMAHFLLSHPSGEYLCSGLNDFVAVTYF